MVEISIIVDCLANLVSIRSPLICLQNSQVAYRLYSSIFIALD